MGAQDSALDVLDGQSWEAGPRQCCGVRRSRADWEDMKKSRADWEEEEPGEWGEVKRSRAERSHAGWRGEDVAEEELRSEQQQWGDELQQQQPQPQQGLGVLRRTQVALSTWTQLKTGASTPSTVLNVPTFDPHLASQKWSSVLVNGGEGAGGSDSCSARGPEKSAGRISDCSHG